MFKSEPIQLLNRQVFIQENTLEKTMEVARIPESLNEARLSSFIAFITGDNNLAGALTIQERYFILLNYLALSASNYSAVGDYSEFFIEQQTAPDFVESNGIYVGHLYGSQVMQLEHSCENTYDWLCGQIAMQCYGDMSKIFGSGVVWEKIESFEKDYLSKTLQSRFEMIGQLGDSSPCFPLLVSAHEAGCLALNHLVETNIDKKGIVLKSQNPGGDANKCFARFRALNHVHPIIKQLIKCSF